MLDKLQQLLVPFIHAIVFTLVFQVALCVSWMFKLSSSPVFVDCSKMCIDRESNPGLSRGRRQFYHWTIYAWQIATNTGSFHTCNLFQVGFPGCSVFVESSIYRALLFLLIVQKMCIDRQSNPCLSRGRRQIYHWTIDAWQIATIIRSFCTCNRIHISFSGCSLCKLNVQIIEFSRFCWLFKNVHRPGIEPLSIAWQATNLPLNHRCLTNCNNYWFLSYMQYISSWFAGCSVFVESSIYRALLFLLIVQKMCIARQSNPFLSRGRRQFYHWTLDAWQIAIFFGSFRHAIYFKSVFYVALCLLKVQFTELSCFCWLFKKRASTGNRTLVYRVAGDKSTTEPSMLDKLQQLLVRFIHAIVFTLVFQVALCVSWMFKLSSSPVFVDCSKMCIDRESNPGLSRGRRQFYHWTIYAWQIATNTGSFHTCNLFQVGFPGCSVFVESSIYRALLFLLIVQKMCIDRQSNPCLSRGRRQIYHWTIDAWQIATIIRSFCTCNRIHISFSGCSLCKLNVQIIEFSRFCWLFKNVHRPGIEPLSIAWQATNLPLNHRCLTNCNNYWFLSYMQYISSWFAGCSVFVESSIYRALLFLLIVQKMCIARQSNPFLSRGRRQFYHWTLDAWQIAIFFGSFRHAIYFKSVF